VGKRRRRGKEGERLRQSVPKGRRKEKVALEMNEIIPIGNTNQSFAKREKGGRGKEIKALFSRSIMSDETGLVLVA